MTSFAYVARDQQGNMQEGTADADNAQALTRQLRERGLWVQRVDIVRGTRTQKNAAAPAAGAETAVKPRRIPGFGKVKSRDLTVFCRQFSTMINAGVSMVHSLTVLEEQAESPNLRGIIREVSYQVQSGESLTRSLSQFPHVFNKLFVGLVRAGEVGGVLDETLNRLATFLEEDLKLRRKVKSAMTYPTLVMIVAILIVVGLVTFIVPKFIALFKDFNIHMPPPTQFLIDCSNFLTNPVYVTILLGTLTLLFVGVNRLRATKSGQRYWDMLLLRLPVFGKLNHRVALARFSRTMSTLMTSGVPILQALETVGGAVDNAVISSALLDAREAVREGERIGDPLKHSKMFPPMVVQMIRIGEETGSLDSMLAKVADFYEAEVDAMLESLTAVMEPILIVCLGGVVGFIVVAMFLPLIAIITTFTK